MLKLWLASTRISQKVLTKSMSCLWQFDNLLLEEYEAELQRMNSGLMEENQQLQYDNKQLGTLLKEYEQSLESVMSSFRLQAVRLL